MSNVPNITTEYETALVATLLLRPSAISEVDLVAEEFIDERCGHIYRAITEAFAASEPTDAVSIADALGREGKAGVGSYAIRLASEGIVTSTPAVYTTAIRSQAKFRAAREIAGQLLAGTKDRNPQAIDAAITALMELNRESTRHEHTAKQATRLAWDEINAAFQSGGKLRGVATGVERLDSRLGGWHRGDLTVVGARPSMGKTALLLNFARAAIEAGKAVGLISAEQPAQQIGQRHMAMSSRVDADRLRSAKIHDSEWNALDLAVQKMAAARYWMYDRSSPSLAEVARIARKWRHAHGIDVLFVDYIQRIQSDTDSNAPRWERVGEVARGLKNLARDLDIPVIALAQVNRAVEQRADQRPRMGDLADSSEIEKEADAILMLYRDEVARPDAQDCERGVAELLLEKNRHGPTGKVKVAFSGPSMRFDNLERDPTWEAA